MRARLLVGGQVVLLGALLRAAAAVQVRESPEGLWDRYMRDLGFCCFTSAKRCSKPPHALQHGALCRA